MLKRLTIATGYQGQHPGRVEGWRETHERRLLIVHVAETARKVIIQFVETSLVCIRSAHARAITTMFQVLSG